MEATSIQQESLVSTATDSESLNHNEDGPSPSVSPIGIAGDERVRTQLAAAPIPNESSSTGMQHVLDLEVGNVLSKQPLTVSGK